MGLTELAWKNDLVDIDVDNLFKPPKSRIHFGMFGNLSLRSFEAPAFSKPFGGNSFQKVRGTFLNRKADSFTTQNPGRFSRLSPDTNLQKAAKDTGTSPWKMNGFNRYFHFSRLFEGNWSKNHPPPGKVKDMEPSCSSSRVFFSRVPKGDALSFTEPTWFSAKNWCLGFFESHVQPTYMLDGSENPKE